VRARGFTLIEVLVALAVVAIGMSAVLSSVSSSARTVSYMRDKTFAQWIALNQLAQVRLQNQAPSQGKSDGELDYAGRHWHWQQTVSDMGFPGIERIDIQVQLTDTPQGKDAPWIADAIGVYGNSLTIPRATAVYTEYTPPPAGVMQGMGTSSSASSVLGAPATNTTIGTGTSTPNTGQIGLGTGTNNALGTNTATGTGNP
jgi:general secretion pathway protein I